MNQLKPISQIEFEKAIKKYEYSEKTDFFELAQSLVNSGKQLEGIILLLATWNFANFRYHMKSFDSGKLSKALSNNNPRFERLRNENIQTINFKIHGNDIKSIYSSLSQISGVGYTGASKIMQLLNPNLFVMWDVYIRGEKSPKSLYNGLWVFSYLPRPDYKKSSSDYVQFLKNMQKYFKDLAPISNRPMAKLIDEYNYAKITIQIQNKEKKNKIKLRALKLLSNNDLD